MNRLIRMMGIDDVRPKDVRDNCQSRKADHNNLSQNRQHEGELIPSVLTVRRICGYVGLVVHDVLTLHPRLFAPGYRLNDLLLLRNLTIAALRPRLSTDHHTIYFMAATSEVSAKRQLLIHNDPKADVINFLVR